MTQDIHYNPPPFGLCNISLISVNSAKVIKRKLKFNPIIGSHKTREYQNQSQIADNIYSWCLAIETDTNSIILTDTVYNLASQNGLAYW